mmetsp:Transcript_71111/g.153284  ORF Transcript_71111/g.153284 Transcript_71111/m.153284 type:complete len:533 (+) Transcript_71111:154-1752(+)
MSAPGMISEGEAYGILLGSLGVFAGVAVAAAFFVYKGVKDKGAEGADFWYSARGSQGWLSLGLSFFASGMGAWVIFAAPETGYYFHWYGVFGYAIASTMPYLVLLYLGPEVRKKYANGFCLTDWVKQRFGRATQLYVAVISVFYMWIYLVAELTSMGTLAATFSGLDPLTAVIPVALVTMLYTMAAGLPASIWTDRAQGVIMSIFIVIVFFACISDLSIKPEAWSTVATWDDAGFEAAWTLILAIIGAGLFDMGSWQRVYSSVDDKQLRYGLLFGSALIFPTMVLFGFLGMLAKAQDLSRATPTIAYGFLALFDLLAAQSGFILCLSFALAVCMVASSVDSLQNGLISVVSKDVTAQNYSPVVTTGVGQLFVLAANVPAIILAAESGKDETGGLGISILNLFLIADLLLLSITVPIFLGLWSMATQNGALAGCFSGILTIFAFGWVEFGTFMAGLEMVTLMAFGNTMPEKFGLQASRTTILFTVLPIVTGCVTLIVSFMERFYEKVERLLAKLEGQSPSSADAIANTGSATL